MVVASLEHVQTISAINLAGAIDVIPVSAIGYMVVTYAGAAYLCLYGKLESDGIIRKDVTENAYIDINKAFQSVGYLVDEVSSDINI